MPPDHHLIPLPVPTSSQNMFQLPHRDTITLRRNLRLKLETCSSHKTIIQKENTNLIHNTWERMRLIWFKSYKDSIAQSQTKKIITDKGFTQAMWRTRKPKHLKKKKHHTSQGSERPPLAASDAVPAARLALQLGSAVRRLPLAANFSLMAAAAAASRTRHPGPQPGLQLRQATHFEIMWYILNLS